MIVAVLYLSARKTCVGMGSREIQVTVRVHHKKKYFALKIYAGTVVQETQKIVHVHLKRQMSFALKIYVGMVVQEIRKIVLAHQKMRNR